jgi:hypothetical protein
MTNARRRNPRTKNPFFVVVATFVVCYIEVVVCVVDDFEHQEKTRPKHQ